MYKRVGQACTGGAGGAVPPVPAGVSQPRAGLPGPSAKGMGACQAAQEGQAQRKEGASHMEWGAVSEASWELNGAWEGARERI